MEPTTVTDICTNIGALPAWAQALAGFAMTTITASLAANFAQPDTKIGRIVNILALYFRKN